MTFRTSISSKGNPRDLLKRGLKSMFHNYEPEQAKPPKAMPPVDTEREQRKPYTA